jgi:hypothetical protein
MFKNAHELDYQRTDASFRLALRRYGDAAESWFDGSIDSVDARLGSCQRLLHSIRATVGRLAVTDAARFLRAADDLEADRRALTALREDLLTGASGREDVVGPPGWRTAAPEGGPEPEKGGAYEPWPRPSPRPAAPTTTTPPPGMQPPPINPQGPADVYKGASMYRGAPFAGYKDFDACTSANSDKNSPDAYCGKIKHEVEGSRTAADNLQPPSPDSPDVELPTVGRADWAGQHPNQMHPQASRRYADEDSDRLHGPFAGYSDWEDCEREAPEGADADKYCGKIYHQVEKGRRRKGEPLTNFQDKESRRYGIASPAAAPQMPSVDNTNPPPGAPGGAGTAAPSAAPGGAGALAPMPPSAAPITSVPSTRGITPLAALDGSGRRWVTLEAAKFVAAHPDTLDDSHELATRAQHYAAVKTSTFTPAHSAALCEAFVAQVCDLGRRTAAPIVRTASAVPTNIDFAPEAMFL